MAQLPVEIIPANAKISVLLNRVLEIANSIQSELRFTLCDEQGLLDALAFAPKDELSTTSFFDSLELARANSRGYHPFIIAFTDAFLTGSSLSNLFGSSRAAKGAALVTYYQVGAIVGTEDDALTGYALYYLARYSMGFISPSVKNHDESRQCIYDRKVNKMDIVDSFRSGSLCDRCRVAIWQSRKGTMAQMDSVDKLIEHASSLVHKTKIKRRPNVFMGRPLETLLMQEIRNVSWEMSSWHKYGTRTKFFGSERQQ